MTSTDIDELETELLRTVADAADLRALEDARVAALGKKGRVSALMKGLGQMEPEDRKTFGQAVNGLKERLGTAIGDRKNALAAAELEARLATEQADVTLPMDSMSAVLGQTAVRSVSVNRSEVW